MWDAEAVCCPFEGVDFLTSKLELHRSTIASILACWYSSDSRAPCPDSKLNIYSDNLQRVVNRTVDWPLEMEAYLLIEGFS